MKPNPKGPQKPAESSLDPGSRRKIFTFLGLLLLVMVWQIASMIAGRLAVAAPLETFRALLGLVSSGEFQRHFWISLRRILAGILIGGMAGFVLGILAGLKKEVRHLLEPLRWTAMSIPPVTVLVLAMLMLGLGSVMVVFVASVLLAPIIYINTVKGMDLVDRRLVELAGIYRFPVWMRIRHVYIPALGAPLAAGMIQVVCSGVRVVVLAELMGAGRGMGAALSDAGTNLDIPTLFAWILLSVLLVAVFEYLVLRPVQHYMERWNRP